jgi:hypothetical protein
MQMLSEILIIDMNRTSIFIKKIKYVYYFTSPNKYEKNKTTNINRT